MSGVDPALYAQLVALPETRVGEILAGEVWSSPRPATRHARVVFELCRSLGDPYGHGRHGPGGWWILPEPEIHLGAHVVVPDLAGWRRETLPTFPDVAAVTTVPDWACEILSPRGARRDRVLKQKIYADHGVGFLWLIDPIDRTLEVLRHTPDGWLINAVFTDDEIARPRPFDATDLTLRDLWVA